MEPGSRTGRRATGTGRKRLDDDRRDELLGKLQGRELLDSTGLSSGDAFIELSDLVLGAVSQTSR
ncbi:hypothetical protein OG562_00230 [Streptomyces sp. NBC_01275]|uniref:hypothetical protein n=1 Tax=Streptomyces sp. NBC_01275 TaxID=2903807 RepID=UPI00225907C9|nr:hypothetical protein [Streptomyces sp. NBC_01275]MCX4759443.1 hypothetical protein [Streptomyces sp. NBC_01275]